MRTLCLFGATFLGLALGPLGAQEKSPLQLGGASMFSDGRSNAVVNWTLDVDSQTPAGVIEGRLTFIGKVCQFSDAPVAGTYRDGKLEFAVQKGLFGCDRLSMKLKEVRAGSLEFEGAGNIAGPGRYGPFDITLSVTAKSR